jgi:hypothetical protein
MARVVALRAIHQIYVWIVMVWGPGINLTQSELQGIMLLRRIILQHRKWYHRIQQSEASECGFTNISNHYAKHWRWYCLTQLRRKERLDHCQNKTYDRFRKTKRLMFRGDERPILPLITLMRSEDLPKLKRDLCQSTSFGILNHNHWMVFNSDPVSWIISTHIESDSITMLL